MRASAPAWQASQGRGHTNLTPQSDLSSGVGVAWGSSSYGKGPASPLAPRRSLRWPVVSLPPPLEARVVGADVVETDREGWARGLGPWLTGEGRRLDWGSQEGVWG